MITDWAGVALTKLMVKPDQIGKSFVATGIASAINGARNHLIRHDDEDDSDSNESFYEFENEERSTKRNRQLSTKFAKYSCKKHWMSELRQYEKFY